MSVNPIVYGEGNNKEIHFPKKHGIDQRLFEIQKWMNSQEAADYLRITVNSLRIKVNRGQIEANRLGKRLRFQRLELDRLMGLPNEER